MPPALEEDGPIMSERTQPKLIHDLAVSLTTRTRRLPLAQPSFAIAQEGAGRRLYSSMNFQLSAPLKRRTRTDAISSGSKFARFTPCFAPGVGCSGSQCVTQPQVRQR